MAFSVQLLGYTEHNQNEWHRRTKTNNIYVLFECMRQLHCAYRPYTTWFVSRAREPTNDALKKYSVLR